MVLKDPNLSKTRVICITITEAVGTKVYLSVYRAETLTYCDMWNSKFTMLQRVKPSSSSFITQLKWDGPIAVASPRAQLEVF